MRVSIRGCESAEKSKEVATGEDETAVEIVFPGAAIADLRPRNRFVTGSSRNREFLCFIFHFCLLFVFTDNDLGVLINPTIFFFFFKRRRCF